jgi:hypothetical protein
MVKHKNGLKKCCILVCKSYHMDYVLEVEICNRMQSQMEMLWHNVRTVYAKTQSLNHLGWSHRTQLEGTFFVSGHNLALLFISNSPSDLKCSSE